MATYVTLGYTVTRHNGHIHQICIVHYDKLAYASNSLLTGRHSYLLNRSGCCCWCAMNVCICVNVRRHEHGVLDYYTYIVLPREKQIHRCSWCVCDFIPWSQYRCCCTQTYLSARAYTYCMHLAFLIVSDTTEPKPNLIGFHHVM